MFTRNKRDMYFQVYPRVAFDARNDYQSALKFFDKSFGEAEDEEDMGNTAAYNIINFIQTFFSMSLHFSSILLMFAEIFPWRSPIIMYSSPSPSRVAS